MAGKLFKQPGKGGDRRFADGLDDQRRLLETISISTRDRATVQKLLTRMESHYYALIRERDEKLRAHAATEAAEHLRLEVLERVASAAELKQRVELQLLESSATTADSEIRTLRRELDTARAFSSDVDADVQAAVLALGAELARVENSEVEVRQVLGFVRHSNILKEKKCAPRAPAPTARARRQAAAGAPSLSAAGSCRARACVGAAHRRLEMVEKHNAELQRSNAQLAAALAEKSALERRFNERNARLLSIEARHKAAMASSAREMAQLRKENEALRAQAEHELYVSRQAREDLLLSHEQLRVFAHQREALLANHAQHHAAERAALRARLRQLAHAMDKAMLRDDIVLRTGGGYKTLPEFLTHLMQVAGPAPEADDDGDRAAAGLAAVQVDASRRHPPHGAAAD
jgi:hypothetical protein